MSYQHKQLASGRWHKLSFIEQMANIGSEVIRALNWQKKNKQDYSERALMRALELLELTLGDKRNKHRLRELARLHEVLADYFLFDNDFKSSPELWQKYFLGFNYAARIDT